MPIQYVNTGTSPNSGNGDTIRTAFTKINNNFVSIENSLNSPFLPDQGGQGGKFLSTDGSTATWARVYPILAGNEGKFLRADSTQTEWVAIYPAQSANAGRFLYTDGNETAWADVFPSQTNNKDKFLSSDGTGTFWADVLPPLSGNAGKYLYSDGVNASWVDINTETGIVSWNSLSDRNGINGPTRIALGRNAGNTDQGDYAIALGFSAGISNQSTGSIVINASTATDINGTNSGLYINPIRNDVTNTDHTVYYNTATKELTWTTSAKPGINSTSSLIVENSPTTIYVTTNTANIVVAGTLTNKEWVFNNVGILTLPVNGDIRDSSGLTIINRNPFDQVLNTSSLVTFDSVNIVGSETSFLRFIAKNTNTQDLSLVAFQYDRGSDNFRVLGVNTTTNISFSNFDTSAYIIIRKSGIPMTTATMFGPDEDSTTVIVGTAHRIPNSYHVKRSALEVGKLFTATTSLGFTEYVNRFDGTVGIQGSLVLVPSNTYTNGIVFEDGSIITKALQVSAITGSDLSNTVTNVTALRFDTDSGFDISELEPGVVKVGMNSTFKTWKVAGEEDLVAIGLDTIEFVEGPGINIYTYPSATPNKQIVFSATVAQIIAGNGIAVNSGTNGEVTVSLNTLTFVATYAENLVGGTAGQIAYQLSPNVTSFISTSSVVVGSSNRASKLETTTGVSRSISQDNSGDLIPERSNVMGIGNVNLRWTNLYLTTSTGVVYFGTSTLSVNTGGDLLVNGNSINPLSVFKLVDTVPEFSTSTGIKGQVALTTTTMYVCMDTNYWLKFDGTVF